MEDPLYALGRKDHRTPGDEGMTGPHVTGGE